MTQRKPPVVAIRGGSHMPDIVTQSDLSELADAQDAEWAANRLTQNLARKIEQRIAEGAKVTRGRWRWDEKRNMARSATTAKGEKAG